MRRLLSLILVTVMMALQISFTMPVSASDAMPQRDVSKMKLLASNAISGAVGQWGATQIATSAGKLTDFVFTTDFKLTGLRSDESAYDYMGFGLNASETVDMNSWAGTTADIRFGANTKNKISISAAGKSNETDIPEAIQFKTSNLNKTYNLYISVDSETNTVVAGMKLSTDTEWTYTTKEISSITAGYLALRHMGNGGTYSNSKIYVLGDYSFNEENLYVAGTDSVTAKLGVKRNYDSVADKGVFITIVYENKGDGIMMKDCMISPAKELTVGTYIYFENEIPYADNENLSVVSYFVDSLNSFKSITEPMEMAMDME